MAGETNLEKLLHNMNPELNEGEYVFCTLDAENIPSESESLFWFREKEGMTVVLSKENADRLGVSYTFVAAWITLKVHSSLEAVGLTAAVSQALTRAGISCNIVAAYYHDHLFVPLEDAGRAVEVLQELTHYNS